MRKNIIIIFIAIFAIIGLIFIYNKKTVKTEKEKIKKEPVVSIVEQRKEQELKERKAEIMRNIKINEEREQQAEKEEAEKRKALPEKLKLLEEKIDTIMETNDRATRRNLQDEIVEIINNDYLIIENIDSIFKKVEKSVQSDYDLPFMYRVKSHILKYAERREISEKISNDIESSKYKDKELEEEMRKVIMLYSIG